MATRTGPGNLSVVTQDELSRSVQKLAVAAPFHRLKSGFVDRFLSRRERHFDHFQTNVIDPDAIFQAGLYNEKPWVTFEQVEIAEVQEYISQGFGAWSCDPAVSPSGGWRRETVCFICPTGFVNGNGADVVSWFGCYCSNGRWCGDWSGWWWWCGRFVEGLAGFSEFFDKARCQIWC